MRYGYFDDAAREYVLDRVDAPVSFTNYLGTQRMGTVISQCAGGYCWLDSPQYHRITRFRPNGVPMDWPGHWVYLRDDEDGDFWSLSWQPVGKPLSKARYECRHGLSYSVFSCDYKGISASQKLFIPRENGNADPVEIFDVRIRNASDRPLQISVTVEPGPGKPWRLEAFRYKSRSASPPVSSGCSRRSRSARAETGSISMRT